MELKDVLMSENKPIQKTVMNFLVALDFGLLIPYMVAY
jgi:hypothetical protein